MQLVDVNAEPNKHVIEHLEDALRQARSGNLRSVALVGATRGNTMYFSWDSNNDTPGLVGGVEMLKHDMLELLLSSKTKEGD